MCRFLKSSKRCTCGFWENKKYVPWENHCWYWLVEHGWSSSAQTAVFNQWLNRHSPTKAHASSSDGPVWLVPSWWWPVLTGSQLDRPIWLAGTGFSWTVPVQSPVKHFWLSTAWQAMFDWLIPAVKGSRKEENTSLENRKVKFCLINCFF
jgi:hypothetical protein